MFVWVTPCNTLQHTAAHYNTLQHTHQPLFVWRFLKRCGFFSRKQWKRRATCASHPTHWMRYVSHISHMNASGHNHRRMSHVTHTWADSGNAVRPTLLIGWGMCRTAQMNEQRVTYHIWINHRHTSRVNEAGVIYHICMSHVTHTCADSGNAVQLCASHTTYWMRHVQHITYEVISCLIFTCHFPQESPIISGSFAKIDLQLNKSPTRASDPTSKSCRTSHKNNNTFI